MTKSEIIDISRTLFSTMAVWPGDTPFQLESNLMRKQGDAVNLSTLTLSAHTGSHVDAPFHFADDGATVDQLDLSPFWGKAQLVTVAAEDGPLGPGDFAPYDLSLAPRLLVRSGASEQDPELFPEKFVFPAPDLARHLSGLGIILYGTDAPSMDRVDSKRLAGHNALWQYNIAILEGLDLRQAPDGLYELVALPLKIVRGDGSPVRAALRALHA